MMALSAFNCVGSQDLLLHTSRLNALTICSAQKKTAIHYKAEDTKMLAVHFCVIFQHGPVWLPLSSSSKTEPSSVKFLSCHLICWNPPSHLLLHRRQKEASSPNPFLYLTVIIMIKFPLVKLNIAQLAPIPQFTPNTVPPLLLTSWLCFGEMCVPGPNVPRHTTLPISR